MIGTGERVMDAVCPRCTRIVRLHMAEPRPGPGGTLIIDVQPLAYALSLHMRRCDGT